ncbi:MAG: Rrf2 family transcriptional regulator [Bacteroidales bacterium]|nr:Rrf2 family transcriptional regulator [Bacteroidales bacterium]
MGKVVTLTEAASIALHGMIIIARSKHLVNVQEIAELTGTSRHHVAKIFQRLVKAGYLYSQRGPTGGFVLRKKPEEITFLDLYEAIEGTLELTPCPLDKPICNFDRCIMNNVTLQMTKDFKEYLKSQTLDMYI